MGEERGLGAFLFGENRVGGNTEGPFSSPTRDLGGSANHLHNSQSTGNPVWFLQQAQAGFPSTPARLCLHPPHAQHSKPLCGPGTGGGETQLAVATQSQ